ncbi:hypothetical protein B9X93_16775, partial [Acinetobacter baumannii]
GKDSYAAPLAKTVFSLPFVVICNSALVWTFQLLENEPQLTELAEIKKYFLSFFPDSVYQLA